jgi:hypothetical protein
MRDGVLLIGWQQIARYMGLSVRTVKQYECKYNFPVRRFRGESHGLVFCAPEEIES